MISAREIRQETGLYITFVKKAYTRREERGLASGCEIGGRGESSPFLEKSYIFWRGLLGVKGEVVLEAEQDLQA